MDDHGAKWYDFVYIEVNMATAVPIEDQYLHSGDMIDLVYQIQGTNETMIALAVHSIKQSVAADPRLDYQSARREYRVDLGTGINYEFLIVRVIVRRYPRGEPEPDVQTAGIWVPIVAVVAMATAAIVAHKAAIVYRTYSIIRVAENPNLSDEVKVATLNAIGQKGFDLSKALGGGNLMPWIIGGVLIAGIYLATKTQKE